MFLKKIYSEPDGLFPVVEFRNGINFIFAKKQKNSDSKESLNGVGKTLLLDLIDYCLLSSETKLIKNAKKSNGLNEYSVVLEFSVDNKDYIIKRTFTKPNSEIIFGKKESLSKFDSISDLKEILCDLIFKNDNYTGKYFNKWLRKLIPFFVKKQSAKSETFSDPIKYIREAQIMELIPYHLFLMSIGNIPFYKNFNLQTELKRKIPAMKEIKEIVQDTYGLEDISYAENEADKLHVQISKLEDSIKKFQLAEQYKDIETQSNNLTIKIKNFFYQNFSDRKKIEAYNKSFQLNDDLSVRKIKNIYSELNEILANNIKKTLDDAINFRKELTIAREAFLADEIKQINGNIKKREEEIKSLESERAKLFNFLEAKNAITDLSEAYLGLSKKREKLNDLSGKIKLYQDLKKEKAELKREEANLYSEIVDFAQQIKSELMGFRKIFFDIHDAIYTESKDKSSFTLTPNENKDAKIDINVNLPADLSKGKNQGRTLIYDLAILFHAISKNIRCPRFLIHDGIFDGMDKAHFVHLYEYLEKISKEEKFQYIITLNEEGTLNDNFGNSDKVTPDKIDKESIITLTPQKTLFKNKWD